MVTLSLIIPFYNETGRIEVCLNALKNWRAPRGVNIDQILFVNDGSTDNSLSLVKRQLPSISRHLHAKTKLITYSKNQGKGYAIAKGMSLSTSDYSLFLDADMSTPLSEVNKMMPAMQNGTDLIIGTRKNGHSTVGIHQPLVREWMGHGFTFMANALFQTHITDFTCGFKAFSRRAKDTIFPRLMTKRWAFDVEAVYAGTVHGLRIREVPVLWNDIRGSKVRLTRDMMRTISEVVKIRFAYRAMSPIHRAHVIVKPLMILLDTVRTYIF